MPTTSTKVLIVGAGPVGLLTALALGKANIPTTVIEKHRNLPSHARATVYQPVVLPVLKDLGIFEELKREAFWNETGIVWRDIQGNALGLMPVEPSEGLLLLGQARMAAFLLSELKKYPSVQVYFEREVVGLDQTTDGDFRVRALVHDSQPTTHDDDTFIEADYVLGCDGANSAVRRMSCIPFEGYTWREITMIGADVYYDFSKANGWNTPMQFLVHPTRWAVIVYTGQDKNGDPYGSAPPLWRVAYVEPSDSDLDPRKVFERAKQRVREYALGNADFELMRAEPYRLHQRCAAQSHKGRVFLAGDALHANNPIGGLGLTTGILDAYAYGNALVRVVNGGESPDLLAQCADSRRNAWLATTNVASTRNLLRLASEKPDDVREREAFFEKLNNDADFPKKFRASMQEMLLESFKKATGGEH